MKHRGKKLGRVDIGRRHKQFAVLMVFAAAAAGCADSRLKAFRLESVQSSAIDTIGYSEEQQALYIKFDNGVEYIFRDVPSSIYEEMRKAPSKGKYFHSNVRGHYKYVRLK
jgi:hypothetical protein